MPAQCAKCGEELLGEVNRCWRCGARLSQHPDRTDTTGTDTTGKPPIAAMLVDARGSPSANAIDEDDSRNAVRAVGTSDHSTGNSAANVRPLRRGSPFADWFEVTAGPAHGPPNAIPIDSSIAEPARYPRHTSAVGGAVGAVVLGVFSLVSLLATSVGPLLTSIMGIAFGVWGLCSEHRRLAVIGLLLCILALVIAATCCTFALQQWLYPEELFDDPTDEDPYPDNSGDFSLLHGPPSVVPAAGLTYCDNLVFQQVVG